MPADPQQVIVMNAVLPVGAADQATPLPIKASETLPITGTVTVTPPKWTYEVISTVVPNYVGINSWDQESKTIEADFVKLLQERFNQGWELHQRIPIGFTLTQRPREMFVFRKMV